MTEKKETFRQVFLNINSQSATTTTKVEFIYVIYATQFGSTSVYANLKIGKTKMVIQFIPPVYCNQKAIYTIAIMGFLIYHNGMVCVE